MGVGAGLYMCDVVVKSSRSLSHLLMSSCLNIVSLTHCIICVLYESLFVNDESRNIGLKLVRLSFQSPPIVVGGGNE